MVQSVFLAGLLVSLALSQAVLLSKKLPDSAGLLRPVKIKVQPKELIDDCIDCQPTPSAKDLNVAILTKLIGGKMNSDIYSITKPTDFDNPKVFKYLSNRHEKARKKYLENFVAHHTKIMGNNGQMTINQKAFLVSWLEEQSSCPLRMEWKDMGPYSWPRYIKRAFCVGKPCSIDPGMRCTASARRFFPLLRWYCIDASHKTSLPAFIGRRQRFVKRDGFLCRWIKYLHPITTQCACQCKV